MVISACPDGSCGAAECYGGLNIQPVRCLSEHHGNPPHAWVIKYLGSLRRSRRGSVDDAVLSPNEGAWYYCGFHDDLFRALTEPFVILEDPF